MGCCYYQLGRARDQALSPSLRFVQTNNFRRISSNLTVAHLTLLLPNAAAAWLPKPSSPSAPAVPCTTASSPCAASLCFCFVRLLADTAPCAASPRASSPCSCSAPLVLLRRCRCCATRRHAPRAPLLHRPSSCAASAATAPALLTDVRREHRCLPSCPASRRARRRRRRRAGQRRNTPFNITFKVSSLNVLDVKC